MTFSILSISRLRTRARLDIIEKLFFSLFFFALHVIQCLELAVNNWISRGQCYAIAT